MSLRQRLLDPATEDEGGDKGHNTCEKRARAAEGSDNGSPEDDDLERAFLGISTMLDVISRMVRETSSSSMDSAGAAADVGKALVQVESLLGVLAAQVQSAKSGCVAQVEALRAAQSEVCM